MTSKNDCLPPLLGRGIHPFKPHELRRLTVEAFANSRQRPFLFERFLTYLDRLRATGLDFEILIGGSFLTKKLNPHDIDLIIVYDSVSSKALSTANKAIIANLLHPANVFSQYRLDIRGVRSSDEKRIHQWLDKFGTQKDDTTPQGLVSVVRQQP